MAEVFALANKASPLIGLSDDAQHAAFLSAAR